MCIISSDSVNPENHAPARRLLYSVSESLLKLACRQEMNALSIGETVGSDQAAFCTRPSTRRGNAPRGSTIACWVVKEGGKDNFRAHLERCIADWPINSSAWYPSRSHRHRHSHSCSHSL